MEVDATIRFDQLCKQLGVDSIAGALNDLGEVTQPTDRITLKGVDVDSSALSGAGCWWPEDEDAYEPPAAVDLADWIRAIAANDGATAHALVSRIFPDDRTQALCEQVLREVAARKAA